jgi:hypothetical protein
MRISGLLLGAVMALSVLTPNAPARAITLSTGQLMYTDLFTWHGQYGTPTWREILGMYDCTEGLTFYLVNTPQPPQPVVVPPVPGVDPVVAAVDPSGLPGGGASVTPTAPLDPIGTPGGDPTGGTPTAVPEPSTWAMLLLGFAGLGYAGFRRSKGPNAAFD